MDDFQLILGSLVILDSVIFCCHLILCLLSAGRGVIEGMLAEVDPEHKRAVLGGKCLLILFFFYLQQMSTIY